MRKDFFLLNSVVSHRSRERAWKENGTGPKYQLIRKYVCCYACLSQLTHSPVWLGIKRNQDERLLVLPRRCGAPCRCHCHPHTPGWRGWWTHSSSLSCGWPRADADWQRLLTSPGWERNPVKKKGPRTGSGETLGSQVGRQRTYLQQRSQSSARCWSHTHACSQPSPRQPCWDWEHGYKTNAFTLAEK